MSEYVTSAFVQLQIFVEIVLSKQGACAKKAVCENLQPFITSHSFRATVCFKDCGLHNQKYQYDNSFAFLVG